MTITHVTASPMITGTDGSAVPDTDAGAGFDALLASLVAPAVDVAPTDPDTGVLPAVILTDSPQITDRSAYRPDLTDAQNEAPVTELLTSVQASQSLGVLVSSAAVGVAARGLPPTSLTIAGPASGSRDVRTSTHDAIDTARGRSSVDPASATAATEHDDTLAANTSARAPAATLARGIEHDAGALSTPSALASALAASRATTEMSPRQLTLPVAPALNTPAWPQAFSAQVLWSARAELQTASLTLNPPELGPVSIELALDDGQASASFSSPHPEVRKAIEDSLPMLRQMFADAGLQLGHADVGSGRQTPGERTTGPEGPALNPSNSQQEDTPVAAPVLRRSSALLDTYA